MTHQHDTIDRITPTLEPDQQVVMYQDWHHLLFLHWDVSPNELQALIPPELTVDTFEGKAYIGVIPFTLTGVRPILLPPLPGVSAFHEVNVRTYVHKGGSDPGVWFFSLDANSHLAVNAARLAYHLNYKYADIDLAVSNESGPLIDFNAHRKEPPAPAHAHIRYAPVEGPAAAAVPGTLEHFLAERYILYSMDADRRLHRARVHHQPYPLQKAEVHALDETLIWASGIKRSENIPLRHYAREVNVRIYPLESV